MKVTTWKGATLGISFGKPNARTISKETKAIEIEIDSHLHSFPLSEKFWTTCPEIRGIEISRWLKKRGLDTWPRGKPHELDLIQIGAKRFRLQTKDEFSSWTSADIKEELSYAYVHAVASHAGFACDRPHKDKDSSDVTVSAVGKIIPESVIHSPRSDLQLKATATVPAVTPAGEFAFDLPRKNYDDLRRLNHVPKLLVLFVMPRDAGDWLFNDENALIARKCCYWCNLYGQPATENEKSKTVYVPKKNIFTADTLRQLMARVSRDEDVGYDTAS